LCLTIRNWKGVLFRPYCRLSRTVAAAGEEFQKNSFIPTTEHSRHNQPPPPHSIQLPAQYNNPTVITRIHSEQLHHEHLNSKRTNVTVTCRLRRRRRNRRPQAAVELVKSWAKPGRRHDLVRLWDSEHLQESIKCATNFALYNA
jgi:hypothetical protein